MSEEKKTSQLNKRKRKKHKHRMSSANLHYIKIPVIFSLILLVVTVPMLVAVMNYSIDYVHTAQKSLRKDSSDIEIINEYEIVSEKDFISTVSEGKRLGSISCGNAGLYSDMYYGINRATLRNGAALSCNSYLPGMGGCVKITGLPVSTFSSVYSIKTGDIVSLKTYWGRYNYKVTKIVRGNKYNEPDGESLLLAAYGSSDAFAAYGDDNFYVIALLDSKEVQ